MYDKRDTEVIQAARSVFWSRGYQATSFQDLTAAGLSRRAVYSRFESKEGLFDAVLTEYRHEYGERMRKALGDADIDGVILFLGQLIEFVDSELHGRGCLVANACSEMAPMQPTVAEHFESHFGELHDLILQSIERDSDSLKIGAEQLAASTVSTILGSMMLSRAGSKQLALTGLRGAIQQLRLAVS